MHLILFAHHESRGKPGCILPEYEAALAQAGVNIDDVELCAFVENGFSSVYHALSARLRKNGRILPQLLTHVGALQGLEAYESIGLVTWSAPYALAEDLLAIPADRDALAYWVALDSGYGPITPGVTDFARLARDRRKLYSAVFTDVQTPTYANSRQFLEAVQLAAGAPEGFFFVEHLTFPPTTKATDEHIGALHVGPRVLAAAWSALGLGSDGAPSRPAIPPPPPTRPTGKATPQPFRVEPRTLRRGMHGDDVKMVQVQLNALGATLHVDGDFGELTEKAVFAFQVAHSVGADGAVEKSTRTALDRSVTALAGRPTEPPSDDRPTDAAPAPGGRLGLAVLAAAREDLAAGVHETAHNDGDEIRKLYLDPAKIPPGSNWCAAAFWSWLRRACAAVGVPMPIPGSSGAKEIMTQIQHAAKLDPAVQWISAEEARARPELVEEGMVVIWDRSDPEKPATSWWGHIGVVAGSVASGMFPTVEGNSGPVGDRVAGMVRALRDPKLLGFGRLPATA